MKLTFYFIILSFGVFTLSTSKNAHALFTQPNTPTNSTTGKNNGSQATTSTARVQTAPKRKSKYQTNAALENELNQEISITNEHQALSNQAESKVTEDQQANLDVLDSMFEKSGTGKLRGHLGTIKFGN